MTDITRLVEMTLTWQNALSACGGHGCDRLVAMALRERHVGLHVDPFRDLGEAREPPRADGGRRALDGMGSLPPGLADARVAQRLHVDRYLVGKQLQYLALERGIAQREASEIGAIDGVARQLIAAFAQCSCSVAECRISRQGALPVGCLRKFRSRPPQARPHKY